MNSFVDRCLSVLAEKVTQTTAMDDRRIRKELQVELSLFDVRFTSLTPQPGEFRETLGFLCFLCWALFRSGELDSSQHKRCTGIER